MRQIAFANQGAHSFTLRNERNCWGLPGNGNPRLFVYGSLYNFLDLSKRLRHVQSSTTAVHFFTCHLCFRPLLSRTPLRILHNKKTKSCRNAHRIRLSAQPVNGRNLGDLGFLSSSLARRVQIQYWLLQPHFLLSLYATVAFELVAYPSLLPEDLLLGSSGC